LSEETSQLIKEKLAPLKDEYTCLHSKETSPSQANPILEEVYHFVSEQFADLSLTRHFVTESGLNINLLAQSGLQKIGFVLFNKRNYCREPEIIDGTSGFAIEMIRNCDIYPIVISEERWKRWNSFEKAQFVRREIDCVLRN